MDKNTLITNLNSRIGILKLDRIVPEIDHIIQNCINFYNRYKPLDNTATERITSTGESYVFSSTIPTSIISVFDIGTGAYITSFTYDAPLMSHISAGDLLVKYTLDRATLSSFVTMPDLLEDFIMGEYCKAIKTKMGMTQIPIEISLDASVLETFIEMGQTAKEMIIEQKDYRMCLIV